MTVMSFGALPKTSHPRPAIVDAGGRALYLGPSFTLGVHRNAVAVIAVGLEAEFTLRRPDIDEAPTPRRSALIPPGQWQHLDAHGGAMAFFYLDADDRGWREMARRSASPPPRIDSLPDEDAALTALLALWRDQEPRDAGWSSLLAALDLPLPSKPDKVIAAAMAAVRHAPAETHSVAMHALAGGCAISTFQRRFTAQAGLPWRRWRLWHRIRHAAKAVCDGTDLTTASYAAGFSSGAHFSDAFRAMFGMPPVRLVESGATWQCVPAPMP